MPPVARGNQHGINIFASEHLSEIRIAAAILILVMGIYCLLSQLATIGACLRNHRKLNLLEAEEIRKNVHCPVAHAKSAKNDAITWCHSAT